MNMSKTRTGLRPWSLLVAAVLCSQGAVAQHSLDIPRIFQEQGLWCWAAVSETMIKYFYDSDVEQCAIVDWVRQNTDGWGSSSLPEGYCCDEPQDQQACNRLIEKMSTFHGDPSIRMILTHWGVASTASARCNPAVGDPPPWTCSGLEELRPEDLEQHVTAGKPFIMRFDWLPGKERGPADKESQGHFVIGYGFSRDPSGGDHHLVSYWDPGAGDHPAVDWPTLVASQGWNLTLFVDTVPPWVVEKLVTDRDVAPGGRPIESVSGNIDGQIRAFDINDDGVVAYTAVLEGAQGGQNATYIPEGIYTSRGAIIAETSPAGGDSPILKLDLPGGYRFVAINDDGDVAFAAQTHDGSEDPNRGRPGIFFRNSDTGHILTIAGQVGDEGGGLPGSAMPARMLSALDLNDKRQIAFLARPLEGGRAVYRWDEGTFTPIMGAMGGIPVLRNDGSVVNLVTRQESDENGQPVLKQAVVSSTGGVMAKGGEQAPGGGTFKAGLGVFNYPGATEDGETETAFVAELDKGEEGVFTSHSRVALSGDQGPGQTTYTGFPGSSEINNAQRVVFVATLSNGYRALMDNFGSTIALAGETLVNGRVLLDLADPVLNNEGQVVFYGRLAGDPEPEQGLFRARWGRLPAP